MKERFYLTEKGRTIRKPEPVKRKINTIRTGDKFRIGSLEVQPIHVAHSVPGAYGFIVYFNRTDWIKNTDLIRYVERYCS